MPTAVACDAASQATSRGRLGRRDRLEVADAEPAQDREQLVDAVRARVAREDRAATSPRERPGELRVLDHLAQRVLHLAAVARDEEVLTGREEALAVVPRRRNERDPRGERLERANGRNARQREDVRAPRNVHRHAVAREHLRRVMVREPPAVLEARAPDRAATALWVPHAVDGPGEAEATGGPEQEPVQLVRALAVAPIPDPDDVARLLPPQRPEQPRIGRLVPDPRAVVPGAFAVDLGDPRAEREHACVTREVEPSHLAGRGDRPVVRVVEERERARRADVAHDAAQEVRIAVVPVRDERVDEEDEPHDDAACSAWGSAAATSSYSSTYR